MTLDELTCEERAEWVAEERSLLRVAQQAKDWYERSGTPVPEAVQTRISNHEHSLKYFSTWQTTKRTRKPIIQTDTRAARVAKALKATHALCRALD